MSHHARYAAHNPDMDNDLGSIEDEDPSVIYDVLRESANRLSALYVRQVTVGGAEDPAILRVRAVGDQVRAVDVGDLEAQVELIGEFDRRWREVGCRDTQ